MPKPIPSISQLSLIEVQSRFTTWRNSKRQHREKIPEELWSVAAQLCEHHSVHKISRALRLNHTDLSKRVGRQQESKAVTATVATAPSPDFVSIGMEPATGTRECLVEMEHRNGNKMRIHFKGASDFDLQSLTDTFWG